MASKKTLIRLMKLVCTSWHFACERRWAELKSAKVCASPLPFFFSSGFLALPITFLEENSQYFHILVCNFFTEKCNRSRYRSRWENLDCGQYRFQPLKFANSVVPSPCETQPYNKESYKFTGPKWNLSKLHLKSALCLFN